MSINSNSNSAGLNTIFKTVKKGKILNNLTVTDTMKFPSYSDFPANPSAGDIFFNTTDSTFYGFDGTTWVALSDGGSGGSVSGPSSSDDNAIATFNGTTGNIIQNGPLILSYNIGAEIITFARSSVPSSTSTFALDFQNGGLVTTNTLLANTATNNGIVLGGGLNISDGNNIILESLNSNTTGNYGSIISSQNSRVDHTTDSFCSVINSASGIIDESFLCTNIASVGSTIETNAQQVTMLSSSSTTVTGSTRALVYTNGDLSPATVTHDNVVVFGGENGISSNNDDSFICKFAGGGGGGVAYTFYTDANGTAGVTISNGGIAWAAVSDRNLKENIKELNYIDILDKVDKLPVYSYNMKGVVETQVCLGPVAQEWHELFPSSKDPLKIETIDLDGVSLASIKGLYAKVKELEAIVQELKAELGKK